MQELTSEKSSKSFEQFEALSKEVSSLKEMISMLYSEFKTIKEQISSRTESYSQTNTNYPSQSIGNPERTVTIDQVDGTVEQVDGTVDQTNVTVEQVDGTVDQSSVTDKEGVVTDKEGTVTFEESNVTPGHGTVTHKEGIVTVKQGIVTHKEGAATVEKGNVTVKEGIVTAEQVDVTVEHTNITDEEVFGTNERVNCFDENADAIKKDADVTNEKAVSTNEDADATNEDVEVKGESINASDEQINLTIKQGNHTDTELSGRIVKPFHLPEADEIRSVQADILPSEEKNMALNSISFETGRKLLKALYAEKNYPLVISSLLNQRKTTPNGCTENKGDLKRAFELINESISYLERGTSQAEEAASVINDLNSSKKRWKMLEGKDIKENLSKERFLLGLKQELLTKLNRDNLKHSALERLSWEVIFLVENSSVGTSGLMRSFSVSRRTLLRDMKTLKQIGLASKSGGNYTSRYVALDSTKALIGKLLD